MLPGLKQDTHYQNKGSLFAYTVSNSYQHDIWCNEHLLCRGQVIRVRAPWIKHNYFFNEEFYIIPNLDTVVLGGTRNHNSWNTKVSREVFYCSYTFVFA